MELRKCLCNAVAIRPAFWVWVLVSLGACKKVGSEQSPPGSNNDWKGKLVRSIEFDNGSIKTMHYNPDSTLRKIAYRYGEVVSATIFSWQDRRLKEMFEEELSFKNVFYYTSSGIAVMCIPITARSFPPRIPWNTATTARGGYAN